MSLLYYLIVRIQSSILWTSNKIKIYLPIQGEVKEVVDNCIF